MDENSFLLIFNELERGLGSHGKSRVLVAPGLPSKGSSRDRYDEAFNKALSILSTPDSEGSLDENGINSFVTFFSKLYGELSYRHQYSDICSVMYAYLDGENALDEAMPPQPLSLSNNVEIILGQFEARGGSKKAFSSLRKLRDHIELERTRLEYAFKQNACQHKLVADANSVLQNAQSSLDETKREYVTILGIFASIVITFTAGSAFSASVLQNINAVSVYRLCFVILLVGLFLFDLVALLLSFIAHVSKAGQAKSMHWAIVAGNVVFALLLIAIVIAKVTKWPC